MSSPILIPQKKANWKDYHNSPAIKEILDNPKLKGVLDQVPEIEEFHELLSKRAQKGSITVNDMQEIFGEMRNTNGPISKEEAMKIAHELIPSNYEPYKIPKKNDQKLNSPVSGKSLRQGANDKIALQKKSLSVASNSGSRLF